MKLADFLRNIAEQGGIVDTDFSALLTASGLAEFEVKDEVMSKFNQTFLTRDRAENDPDIIKKIKTSGKAEVLDAVDSEFKSLLDLLPKEKADEISKNKNSFEKIKLSASVIKEILNDKSTKIEKDIQNVEKEWAEKVEAIKQENARKLAELEKINKANARRYVLKNQILGYEFADAFKPLKENLADVIINKIENLKENGSPVILDLDESGNVNVRHEVEGTLRDIYREGNKKVTLEMLLTPEVEPYTKKSNGDGGTGDGSNGKQKNIKTPPVDPSKMTLHEMRNAGVAV